jgi:myo-inositol-1-phosphate synthase
MKLTRDERDFFDYMVLMHKKEGGYSQKDAEQNAMFDVQSRRSVGNPQWRSDTTKRNPSISG